MSKLSVTTWATGALAGLAITLTVAVCNTVLDASTTSIVTVPANPGVDETG
jgi:hypothetical protein